MGLLEPLARVGPPGNLPDERPGHATHLAQHERLLQQHLYVGGCREQEVLGKDHFKTEQGGKNFTDAEARATFVEYLDYHRRDL